LDVTIQAQIIELVKQLKAELGMAIIWITHDLGVIAGIADTINVMYAGYLIERGTCRDVFHDPRNAYTLGLLGSLPRLDVKGGSKRLVQIEGAPPDLRIPPKGDPFAPRNPIYRTERCFEEMPPLRQVEGAAEGHLVAAWYDLKKLLQEQEGQNG
jgi:peptide/nickel transport system ATP-binding protein/oligopeptide transport system ATP-binding protein